MASSAHITVTLSKSDDISERYTHREENLVSCLCTFCHVCSHPSGWCGGNVLGLQFVWSESRECSVDIKCFRLNIESDKVVRIRERKLMIFPPLCKCGYPISHLISWNFEYVIEVSSKSKSKDLALAANGEILERLEVITKPQQRLSSVEDFVVQLKVCW